MLAGPDGTRRSLVRGGADAPRLHGLRKRHHRAGPARPARSRFVTMPVAQWGRRLTDAIRAALESGDLKPEQVADALRLLVELDWLAVSKRETEGRTATVYEANPTGLQ